MDQSAVPIIVLARREERCEAINSILRNAGRAVHCAWSAKIADLKERLESVEPHLIVLVGEEQLLDDVIAAAGACEVPPPVVLVTAQASEDVMADAMLRGARDVVSFTHKGRLGSVLQRELNGSRLERSLQIVSEAATDYRRQIQILIENSPDSMALVQEGIVVVVNPSWLELFGFTPGYDLAGHPILDMFAEEDHEALKSACTACAEGTWLDNIVRASGIGRDHGHLSLDLQFEQAEFEGDPCVRIRLAPAKVGQRTMRMKLSEVTNHDALTGFYTRAYFLEKLQERLGQPSSGGVRAMAYIKPDRFGKVSTEIGPFATDELLQRFSMLLGDLMHPNDLHGRLGGTIFGVLLARGTSRDVDAWASAICEKVAESIFEIDDKSVSLTCTVGIAEVGQSDSAELVSNAQRAHADGRREGGNRVALYEPDTSETTSQAYDEVWVRHIRAALMENRFRLVHQPIANLQGETQDMYDVLVRMLDERDNEVLPSEFLPAAERNKLMINIDRWVIGAALALCASRKPTRVFIRLSKDSVKDKTLARWLKGQFKASGAVPEQVCFQVTEEIANKQMKQTKRLVTEVFKLGSKFAIEHFGIGPQPMQVITHLPMDYVKIDGSLMQGLSGNQANQQAVSDLIREAKNRNIATIAERVEDANTIAVLWQLGLEFMQGHYVQEPEIVIEEQTNIMDGLAG